MNTSSRISSGATTACFPANRQHGAVLIITLVMLLLLTLIGIVGMQDTNLQERMAGNQWDRNMAFQGAEAGLRVGEGWLEGPVASPAEGVARRAATHNFTELQSLKNWDGTNEQPSKSDAEEEYKLLGELAEDAHLAEDEPLVFYIDPPTLIRLPGDISLDDGGECQRYFPVTSYSTGGSESAVVILRSTYVPRQSGMVGCEP